MKLNQFNTERGEGEGHLLVWVLGRAIAWAVGCLVLDFFRDYKESRMNAYKAHYEEAYVHSPYTGPRMYQVTYNK